MPSSTFLVQLGCVTSASSLMENESVSKRPTTLSATREAGANYAAALLSLLFVRVTITSLISGCIICTRGTVCGLFSLRRLRPLREMGMVSVVDDAHCTCLGAVSHASMK